MDFPIYPFYFNYKIMAITNIPKLTKIQTPTPEQMIKTLGVVGGVEYLSQIKDSVKNIEKSLDAKVQQSYDTLKEAENQITRNLGSRKRRSDFGGVHKKAVPKKASISEKVAPQKDSISPKDVKQRLEQRRRGEGKVLSPVFKKMISGVGRAIQKTFSFLKEGFKDFFEGLKEPATKAFQAFLGPLNLILQPLGDLFGKGLGKLFGKVKDKWKEKGKKVKPSDTDIRQANPETFWLYRKLKGKDDPEGEGFEKFLQGGFGKMASKLFPILAKVVPIAAIVGGVIWGVFDAFKAVGKAYDWGVSKTSAGIAGFFAGSGEGGFKDAFKNAGKLALLGAGIGGLAGGPLGALAGGLIGAALGLVLGFIGGKEVAKSLDTFGSNIKRLWTEGDIFDKFISIPSYIIDSIFLSATTLIGTIPKMIASIFIKDKDKLDLIGDTTRDVFRIVLEVFKSPVNIIRNLMKTFTNAKNIFKDKDLAKDEKVKEILKQVLMTPFQGLLKIPLVQKVLETGTGKKVAEFASNTFEKAFTVGKDAFDYLKNSIGKIREGELSVKDFVKDTVMNVFNFIKVGVDVFFKENPLGKWLKKYIMDPITRSFKVIGTFFEFLRDLGVKGIFEVIFSKEDTFASRLEEFGLQKDIEHYSKAGLYNQAYQDARRDVQREAAQMREILSKEELEKRIQKRAVSNLRKVDDAIITPYGRIIEPHKDDTIIATKSPILHRKAGFEPTIKEAESIINTNEIVDNLKTLISVIKDKPFNNVFSTVNQSQVNFAELRMI